jgi:hypothetical protein
LRQTRRIDVCGNDKCIWVHDKGGELQCAFDARVRSEKRAVGEEQQEWLVYPSIRLFNRTHNSHSLRMCRSRCNGDPLAVSLSCLITTYFSTRRHHMYCNGANDLVSPHCTFCRTAAGRYRALPLDVCRATS